MTTITTNRPLSEVVSVTWGPSPVEPINIVSVKFDDDIVEWEGTPALAAALAGASGLTTKMDTADGRMRWTR